MQYVASADVPFAPSTKMIEARHKQLMERYAAVGLPLTTQRRVLISVLAGRLDHPTVDQIYSAVSQRLPEVSRTTVYRSLEVLAELKLIKRVEHPGSAVRFDPNMEAHHHFFCTRCGALSDLPTGAILGHEHLEFVGDACAAVEEISIFARGVCDSCA